MKRSIITIFSFVALMFFTSAETSAQSSGGFGSGEVFNPFHTAEKDSSKTDTKVPMEIHQWHIDEALGTVIPVNADTLQYMYQNWAQTEGMNGEYNFLGNMGSPRQSRIFFNRPTDTTYDFLAPYDYFITSPGELFFTDTKSPYTNLTYHTSGDKVDGDDRFRAYFARSANKHFGVGGMFDYLYGRGRYDNQTSALMNFSVFSYYRNDRYNYHLVASRYHMKHTENGGITNDDYIKRPEETDGSSSNFTSADIPVNFNKTWNRNEVYKAYFTHNYNLGFYKEKPYELQVDTTATDTLEIKKPDEIGESEDDMEFVRVARITHTVDFSTGTREFRNYELPENFYADDFLRFDSVDQYKNISLENRIGFSLCEGFSKWAFADITAYASYKYNRYTMPDTMNNGMEWAKKYNEHTVFVGGIVESNLKNIKYKIQGETAVSGNDLGAFSLDGYGIADFTLWGKPARLEAVAFIKNNRPSFYYRHFHSEHYWWDYKLDKEFKARAEFKATIEKTRTKINVGMENIKNYTYLANNSIAGSNGDYLSSITVKQADENIRVVSATLCQGFKLGFLNIDTELTYQKSSNEDIIPLPDFNLYANMYIKFKIAKVLNTELGADVRYFTSYYASDYSAALGQFCQQNQAEKIEIGDYPIASVYANFLLKQTRFYVKYQHANEGTGNMNYFLVPHYPLNPAVLWFGLSWNFYN